MAIIKFISDKSCHLYIDLEFVGEVQPNKILRISLDTGSYLVEVKNNKDCIVKKYVLSIKPTDIQILQNIEIDETIIENVVENLRNDSTLKFHHQRARFCYNGLYGFINSQYKVVIPPVYSYADDFLLSKSFVKKKFPNGEKATTIDSNGNICLEQWYDYIGSDDKKILLKSCKTYYVLSRDTLLLINKYHDARYDGRNELIPVYKEIGIDRMYGYIDTAGNEIIPFIYDYVWNFESIGFAKVKRFGNIHAVDKNGTLFISMGSALEDGKPIKNIFGQIENPNEIYHAKKITKEESQIKGFDGNYREDCCWEYYPIKECNSWGLGIFEWINDDSKNDNYKHYKRIAINKIDKYQCDRIIYYANGYFVYRQNGTCKLLDIANPDKIYSFDAEEVIVNVRWKHIAHNATRTINNVILKKNNKYGITDINGNILLPIEYDLILTTDAMGGQETGNIGIVWQGEKCSFVRMSDAKILDHFKYDDIIINNPPNFDYDYDLDVINSIYIVKENGKYGCIDFYLNIILSSIYDKLDFEFESDLDSIHYKIMLYKDGKIGTHEYCKYYSRQNGTIELDFTIPPEFDECVFLKNNKSVNSFIDMSYVAVRKNNTWGIIDNTPANSTYFIYNVYDWKNSPNICDLEYKYNSLDELKEDADTEFHKRIDKYFHI